MDRELYEAARSGDANKLREFWEKQEQAQKLYSSKTAAAQNALHIAAGLGNLEFVKAVVSRCRPNFMFAVDSHRETPLHYAARHGKFEVAQFLINSTRDVDVMLRVQNTNGNTALHEALMNGHETLALALLEANPIVWTIANNDAETSLHLAAKADLSKVVEKILEYAGKNEEQKKELRRSNIRGQTALHFAARRNNETIVEKLLCSDSSLAYNSDGQFRSALHVAAASGSWKAVSKLLNYCPDAIEQQENRGRTALHIAICNNSWDEEEVPQQSHWITIIDRPDYYGNTPLHLATKALNTRLIKWLLRCPGIDVNARNKDGFAALDIACSLSSKFPAQAGAAKDALKAFHAGTGKPWHIIDIEEQFPHIKLKEELAKEVNATYAVAVALVATVSFGAILQVPGGFKDDGTAPLAKRAAFYAFLIFDVVAMCCAIGSGVCLIRETKVRLVGKVWNVDVWAFWLAAMSYIFMEFTFFAALLLVVPSSPKWFIAMAALLCCTPIAIDIILFFCHYTDKNPQRLLLFRMCNNLYHKAIPLMRPTKPDRYPSKLGQSSDRTAS